MVTCEQLRNFDKVLATCIRRKQHHGEGGKTVKKRFVKTVDGVQVAEYTNIKTAAKEEGIKYNTLISYVNGSVERKKTGIKYFWVNE